MANRLDVKTTVKDLIQRDFAGIDNIIDKCINGAVELFGSTITSLYDESEYDITVSSGDVTAKTSSWTLPTTTKFILDGTFLKIVSGQENVYFPIKIASQRDWYNIYRIDDSDGVGSSYSFNYAVDPVIFGGGKRNNASRVDRVGQPRLATRIANKIHVFPRPGTNEIDSKIHLILANKPAILTADTGSGSTNTITLNYPEALAWYTTGMMWAAILRDQATAQSVLSVASVMLSQFATEQEIAKLINIQLRVSRG